MHSGRGRGAGEITDNGGRVNNPVLYVVVALLFSTLLNWVTSRFADLGVGLFNTAVGLLFGATANLALLSGAGELSRGTDGGLIPLVAGDYAVFLCLLQFAFGIFVISSHFAARRLRDAPESVLSNRAKEALFYTFSVVCSLANCHIMTIIFLDSTEIFAPVQFHEGELEVVISRFLDSQWSTWVHWAALAVIVFAGRFFRELVTRVARPVEEATGTGGGDGAH